MPVDPAFAQLPRAEKLNAVLEVAKALNAERRLDALLPRVMKEAARVVQADRCTLFVLDRKRQELWSRVAQGTTAEIRVKLGEGLAGHVARTGEVLNLGDAYLDPRFNPAFDVAHHYRTQSMLCVPMRDALGQISGVIQAINAEDGAFDQEDEEMLAVLGGQAAVAIENSLLHQEISALFEGVVQASVVAIEQRDPSTAGHSNRVAALTLALAQKTEQAPPPRYRGLCFTPDQMQEMRYAALLHDFGKVGVREAVLVKANKLFPEQRDILRARFDLAKKDASIRLMENLVAAYRQSAEQGREAEQALALSLQSEWEHLETWWQFVESCNRPTVLPEGSFERLHQLCEITYLSGDGTPKPLLEAMELEALSIPKGSLTHAERQEIQSHVSQTYRFLSQIPWSSRLSQVPDIAHAHHEAVDGTGYPQSIPGQVIPVQSKMMSIADIYDALTAADRPYKKAVPHAVALDILSKEAKSGKLDADLLAVFVEAEVPAAVPKLT